MLIKKRVYTLVNQTIIIYKSNNEGVTNLKTLYKKGQQKYSINN